jgi:hypothetical protein
LPRRARGEEIFALKRSKGEGKGGGQDKRTGTHRYLSPCLHIGCGGTRSCGLRAARLRKSALYKARTRAVYAGVRLYTLDYDSQQQQARVPIGAPNVKFQRSAGIGRRRLADRFKRGAAIRRARVTGGHRATFSHSREGADGHS